MRKALPLIVAAVVLAACSFVSVMLELGMIRHEKDADALSIRTWRPIKATIVDVISGNGSSLKVRLVRHDRFDGSFTKDDAPSGAKGQVVQAWAAPNGVVCMEWEAFECQPRIPGYDSRRGNPVSVLAVFLIMGTFYAAMGTYMLLNRCLNPRHATRGEPLLDL